MSLLALDLGGGVWDGLSIVAGIVLTLIPVLASQWLNRRRARHVLVRETGVEPVRESVASWDEQASEPPCPEMEPTSLSRLHLEITNRSLDTIDNAMLTLVFPDGTEVKEVFFDVEPGHESPPRVLPTSAGNEAKITIPYLNSYRLHRDRVSAWVTCSGSPKLRVLGKGNGWSVRYVALRDRRWRLWLGSLVLETCFFAILGVNLYFDLWVKDWLTRTARGTLLGALAAAAALLAAFVALDILDVVRQARRHWKCNSRRFVARNNQTTPRPFDESFASPSNSSDELTRSQRAA